MKLKKTVVYGCILIIMITFIGCKYSAYTDYYTNVEDYEEIWSLPDFQHGYDYGEVSDFFPESLDDLNVYELFCRYDRRRPLGEGIQIYLEIYYEDAEVFATEVERISQMGFECNEQFDDTDFLAYATKLGKDYDSEYALIDEEEQIIYYIYLGGMSEEEIELDEQFIPNGYYDWGEVDTDLSETE